MTDQIALSVADVRKRYGATTAVDGVSFEVRVGECFGLLGPNGAGKTTTLSMVSTLIRPESGRVTVGGHDVAVDPSAVRRVLGYVPQELSLYSELTARENLEFFGRLFGIPSSNLRPRVDAALDIAGLVDRAADRVDTFSGGMKRRLNLAAGLVHEPSLVLLDEPTVGVDPQSRNHLFDMVQALKRKGVTLVYTTHYMEEAERLCDRIGIMDHGKIVAVGTRDELLAKIGAREQLELTLPDGVAPDGPAVASALAGYATAIHENTITLPVEGVATLMKVLDRFAAGGVRPQAVTLRKPDLETVFLALTGRALRD